MVCIRDQPEHRHTELQFNVGDPTSFYVAPADFVGRTGNWYRWNGANQGVAFNVVDPNIDIKVWDQNANKDVTGKQVPVRQLPELQGRDQHLFRCDQARLCRPRDLSTSR